MKLSLGAFALTLGLVAACASTPEEPSAAPTAKVEDRIVVDASAESRRDLGVVRWGIDVGRARATVIRGYDAKSAKIVELEQKAGRSFRGEREGTDYPHTFDATLRIRDRVSTLKIEASDTKFRVVTNDLGADAKAALARIDADLRDRRGALIGTSTVSRLAPADALVNGEGGVCLARTCDPALLSSATAGTSAASSCAAGQSSCGSDVSNSRSAQSSSDAKCDCGSCGEKVQIEGPAVREYVQTFADQACCAVKSTDGAGGACKATTYDSHQPSADLALDMPTSPQGYGTAPESHDFGEQLAAFALQNMAEYKIEYVIYRQRISFGDGWKDMEDRGSITQNHFDHVHVSFLAQ